MFRSRDDVYEARIADLKEQFAEERRALNKVIEALAEQIEYLRVTLGKPAITRAEPTPGLSWQGPEGWDELLKINEDELPRHLSEEEEDLLSLREANLISDEELAAARVRLGVDT